ncbi:MAG: hypothetical protein A3J28_03295 [Acidobacteria bacterium RIFCSPLOWO2_12_FULL_60_22]|nr:MAG: hypothetical protein A3J28_03295 [Acidobacteria bacterium RIFCSPLOWO2_12_FULL_60_22]
MRSFIRISIWFCLCGLAAAQIEIPEGTRVKVRLEEDLTSATAEKGQSVRLSVVEEVKIGGTVVIAPGAKATGTVVVATPKRLMTGGKLDFSVDGVTAADGETIPIRYRQEEVPGMPDLKAGIISAGATMVLGPAAPLLRMMRAKDITMEKGIVLEVFTNQSHALPAAAKAEVAKAEESSPAAVEPPVELVDVSVNSTPDGARIVVDGMDVGDTPTSFRLKPGEHELQIEKEGFAAWKSKITATPGTPQSIEAKLEQPAPAKPAAPQPAAAKPATPAPKTGATRVR